LQKANADIQQQMDPDTIFEQAPGRTADFERLTSEAGQTRTLFNTLNTRYQEALVSERTQTGQTNREFQILDQAVPAESPSAPDRQLLLGISVVIAIVVGLGMVLLLERLDRSFRSVDELRRSRTCRARDDSAHRHPQGQSAAGADGHADGRGRVGRARPGQRRGVSFRASGGTSDAPAPSLEREEDIDIMSIDRPPTPLVDRNLVTFCEPRSFEAEQYQRLRQQIERLSAARQLRVIAVTSAVVGDGKTFTALNLAGALAQRKDRKVLVIDADLRRPSVMPRLGLDPSIEGLASALQSSNGSFQRFVRPIEGTTLSVLPGEVAPNGTYELLTSGKFAELIKEARAHYDYAHRGHAAGSADGGQRPHARSRSTATCWWCRRGPRRGSSSVRR
jgi:hypothetical protein